MKWLKTKEVRKRIIYTLFILLLFQLGTFIPLPYIQHYKQTDTNLLLNLLSGGTLYRFGILMLGISPYITSSIIVGLLQKAIPSWKRKSETTDGKTYLGQVQRVFTLIFALIQSYGILYSNIGQVLGLVIPSSTTQKIALMVLMSVGALFTSYLGERITENGVGNGASVLIGFGILSQIPLQIYNIIQLKPIYESTNTLNEYHNGIVILIGLFLGLFLFSWIVNKIEFKYPLQSLINDYKVKAHYFPIKLLASSVMPIIFATATLTLCNVLNNWYGFTIPVDYKTKAGLILYVSLIFIFSFIYNYTQIDGEELQEQFLQSGVYLLNLPQYKIKKFINRKLFIITLMSSPILVVFASLSIIIEKFIPEQFGLQLIGISLLILVGVLQEIIFQVKGLTDKNNYKEIFK